MSNSLDHLTSYFLTQGLTISCAESCTGGLLSDKLVQRPGASTYFKASIVAYSEEVKKDFLTIPSSLIEKKGVVSPEVARAMAFSCKFKFKTDWALSSTGWVEDTIIGQKVQKPIVYIGVAGPNFEEVVMLQFDNKSRNEVRSESVIKAFDFLSKCIKNKTK